MLNTEATRTEEAAIRQRAIDLLHYVRIEDRANDLAKNLSYGDQRRLEIARALATDPKLLCLDEPAAGMNATETAELRELIEGIRRDGTTILLIEHDVKLVMGLCDRVAVLDRGFVVEHGPVADVLLHPKHPVTRGMVRESSHHEESADLGSVLGLSGPLLRLTFLGEITYQPVLENIAKALGVSFNILEGVIGRIKDTPYGQLTVQVIGSEADVGRVEAAFEDHAGEGLGAGDIGPLADVDVQRFRGDVEGF